MKPLIAFTAILTYAATTSCSNPAQSEAQAIAQAREYLTINRPDLDISRSAAHSKFEKPQGILPSVWVVDFQLAPTEQNDSTIIHKYAYYVVRVFVWGDGTFDHKLTIKEE